MKLSNKTKKIILIFIIYFFLAWLLSSTYFLTHLSIIPDEWNSWHDRLLSGHSGSSLQYRVMSIWIVEGIRSIFSEQSFIAYLIMRFIFILLLFILFHLFLRKWFNDKNSLLAVILLAAIMPISFLPMLQEADVVHMVFFLIGIWLIRSNKFLGLLAIIFIGTFAKETIIFLIPLYLIINWRPGKKVRAIVKSLLLLIIWTSAFYITRELIYPDGGSTSSIGQLLYNFNAIKNYILYNPIINYHLYYIPLFGIFWFLVFTKLKQKPYFLRRGALFIVVFMVLHFIMGWPEETRIVLPLAFIVIPSGLISLFPEILKE